MDWINQKTIDGKVYTAYRGEDRKQYVECDGVLVECRLKEAWNNEQVLTSLFNASNLPER